jgi:hypothetical protein
LVGAVGENRLIVDVVVGSGVVSGTFVQIFAVSNPFDLLQPTVGVRAVAPVSIRNSSLKKPHLGEFVGFGIDGGVQPVAINPESSEGFVHCTVLRGCRLSTCLWYVVLNIDTLTIIRKRQVR